MAPGPTNRARQWRQHPLGGMAGNLDFGGEALPRACCSSLWCILTPVRCRTHSHGADHVNAGLMAAR